MIETALVYARWEGMPGTPLCERKDGVGHPVGVRSEATTIAPAFGCAESDRCRCTVHRDRVISDAGKGTDAG